MATKAWTIERHTKHAGGSPLIDVMSSRNKAIRLIEELTDVTGLEPKVKKVRNGYYVLDVKGIHFIIRGWKV